MSFDYRRPWTPEEDSAITSLVQELGIKNWNLVASALVDRYSIKNRSGKQCRERWHNHLDSSVDKKPWTQEEDELIFELHKQFGKSWSKIAEQMPGRTDNSVKNRFYSTLRRNLRKYNKARPHSERLIGSVRTILRNPEIPEILLKEQAPPRLKKGKEQKGLEKNSENNDLLEKEVSCEVVVPTPKVETGKGFEKMEDAGLLYNLTQPEMSYFYFYPQARDNYKNGCNFPQFMFPLFPPGLAVMQNKDVIGEDKKK